MKMGLGMTFIKKEEISARKIRRKRRKIKNLTKRMTKMKRKQKSLKKTSLPLLN